MNDIAASKVSADILWNSDITLQAALVKDGYALQYSPAVNSAVLPFANIGDAAFVTGFDPVVMVYNKSLVSEKELPLTKSALLKVLPDLRWKGKIGVCDPEKSQLAFLLLTQDLAYGQNFWGLVRKFGDAGLKIYPDYPILLERVEKGEVLAGYNLPLSEVLKVAGHNKNIGWTYTTDYTLAIPQTVLITKRATNPAAARLWIDFIRSKQAQQIISAGCSLFSVRSDVADEELKKQGITLPPGQTSKMIGTGPEVTRFSQSGLNRGFLLRWKQLLKIVK
jgi:iron(III) transport system substrate-binding protein